MIHARPDYDRIQDPFHAIPEQEPVFLLRGQDACAAEAVRYYAELVEKARGDQTIVAMAKAQARLMDAWPAKKMPDFIRRD